MTSEEIYEMNGLTGVVCSGNDACEEMLGSDLVNEDIDETTNEQNRHPDFIEERFRVDRRKLEELIRADENGICAEEFFSKVMKECDVYIAWPSKLKIGAKSKKDPYVKVSGMRNCVADAKNKILSSLTTKSLRVTLKMNVSHTEHSHVIGKGGNNIKKVMMETACHIHFPDSNRNNNAAEKSSQVSVAGLFPAVENARLKIRDLLPLVFAFDVPILCPGQLNVELLSLVENVQQKYGVNISVKPHALQSYLMTVFIRTSVHNTDSAMKAGDIIFEHLTGRSGVPYGVSLMMDLSTQHQTAVASGVAVNLNQVMQWTGTTIHIPDQSASNHVTMSSVGNCQSIGKKKVILYINGTMPNVFIARQYLLDCLPIVLMFDCDEDTVINPGEITKLSEELQVQVVVKLKPKHPSKSVIIKSTEMNVDRLYQARRRILNLREDDEDEEGSGYKASKPFSASSGYLQQCPYKLELEGVVVLPNNTARSVPISVANFPPSHSSVIHPVVVLPSNHSQQQAYNSPCQLPQTLYFSSSPSHLVQRPLPGGISLSPTFGPYLDSAEIITSHLTCNGETAHPPPPHLKTASVSVKDHFPPNCSSAVENPNDDVDPKRVGMRAQFDASPAKERNKDTSSSNFNQLNAFTGLFGDKLLHNSGNFHSHSLHHSPSLFRESEFSTNLRPNEAMDGKDAFGLTGFQTDPPYGLLPMNWNDRQHLIMDAAFSKEGDLESSSSSSQGSSLNHSTSSVGSAGSNKAPGSNRPNKSINSSGNSQNEQAEQEILCELDYIKLKNLANQVMQKKPDGECRFPTDCWSGFGFSKSMPQAAIAEKLNQFNHLRYDGPLCSTQYENACEDSDDGWSQGLNRSQQEDFNKSKTIISFVNQLSNMSISQSDIFGSSDSLRRPLSPQWMDREPPSDLDPLFNEIGLSKYINIFKQQEIDMATFLTLTDQDLKDLGIITFGARRKMLLAITDLTQKQSALPPPPGLTHPFRDPNFFKRRDVISHSIRW